MNDLDKELMEAADAMAPSQDKLDIIRDACRHARGLIFEIQSLQENLKERNKELTELRYERLPTLFVQTGVDRVDLAAEGNMPAYSVKMEEHYHANIKGDWSVEQKEAAFDWLEKEGLGDLIKRVIEIRIGLRENKLYNSVIKVLKKIPGIGNHLIESRSVPWNTLTAWLKERYANGEDLGDADLARIGGFVGKVVNLKQAKE